MTHRLKKGAWGKRWFPLAIWICLFLILNFTVAITLGIGQTNVAPNYKDYFLKNADKKVSQTVYNVNRNHLKPALKLYAQGRPKSALPDLKFVLTYVPNHPKALQLMGVVAIEIESPKLGSFYFQQAVHLFPTHALTFAQYGKYLVDIGEFEEAVRMLEIAIKKNPRLALGYGWLEQAYAKKGDVAKSKEMARKAKELGYKK